MSFGTKPAPRAIKLSLQEKIWSIALRDELSLCQQLLNGDLAFDG